MAVRGFRQSGEFRESKGFGPAGAGLRDAKQKERGRQAGKELKEALQRGKTNIKGTEYTGELAEAMRTANIDQFNRRQLSRRAAEESPRPSIMQGIRGLTSQLTPQRLIGSVIGNALLPGIGGLLGGIIGGTYGDDDPSNNFFGNIGASLRKDVRDTIDFFRPQQVEQPMMTNIPMRRPTQFTPTLDSSFLESDLIDPSMRGDFSTLVNPDLDFGKMAPAGSRRPMFDATGGGFGLDSLMQPTDEGLSIKAGELNIPDDMMFRAQVNPIDNPIATSGTLFGARMVPGTSLNNAEFAIQPVSDTGGALTFGPTVFGEEGFESLIAKGLTPVTVERNMTPAFLRRDR